MTIWFLPHHKMQPTICACGASVIYIQHIMKSLPSSSISINNLKNTNYSFLNSCTGSFVLLNVILCLSLKSPDHFIYLSSEIPQSWCCLPNSCQEKQFNCCSRILCQINYQNCSIGSVLTPEQCRINSHLSKVTLECCEGKGLNPTVFSRGASTSFLKENMY